MKLFPVEAVTAANLGIHFHLVPIDALHQAYEQTLYPTFDAIVRAETTRVLPLVQVQPAANR